MTNQEKKAYLGRYRDNEREIRRLQEEILRWESQSRKTTVSFGGAGGTGGNGEDRLQVAVEKIVRLQNRLTAQVVERVRLREQIEDAIGTVGDERLRLLLKYRYIDGWRLEKISVEMNYSYERIRHMHGRALSELKVDTQKHK